MTYLVFVTNLLLSKKAVMVYLVLATNLLLSRKAVMVYLVLATNLLLLIFCVKNTFLVIYAPILSDISISLLILMFPVKPILKMIFLLGSGG